MSSGTHLLLDDIVYLNLTARLSCSEQGAVGCEGECVNRVAVVGERQVGLGRDLCRGESEDVNLVGLSKMRGSCQPLVKGEKREGVGQTDLKSNSQQSTLLTANECNAQHALVLEHFA